MTKKEVEGFLSSPFFDALKPEGVDVDTLYTTLKNSFEYDIQDDYHFYMQLLEQYKHRNNIDGRDEKQLNDEYINAVKQVMLEYLIQEDALRYFCLTEDYERITKIVERKQINSKLLVGVLNRFAYLMRSFKFDISALVLILNNDIKRKISEITENYIIKTMGPLKQKIDKIASGVNIKCYLAFNQTFYTIEISENIEAYIKEKSGYDLNNADYRYANKMFFEKVLSKAIIDDDSIWNYEEYYHGRTILSFATLVEKYNDIKHATKILDYAFDEACKDEKIKFLYDNKLPFFLYNIENDLINWSINRLSVYLSKTVDFKIKKEELNGFIYPLYDGFNDFISKGKEIFKNFLKFTYPKDFEKVESEFNNLDNVIQESQQVGSMTRRELTVRFILNYHLLGYNNVELKEKYLSLYCKDFLNDDSVLGRLYYKLYIIDKYAKDYSNECIYEYLYEILKLIESKNNFKSTFVLDTKLRESKLQILKDVLSKYDINVDDNYKDLYVISLLDRKYASVDEAAKFAELEQFGDAIYDLAVDNILFYDPENKKDLGHETREELVNAEAQIKVSKHIGIDKAYISKFNDAINRKYDNYEAFENGINDSRDGHYLADSLEMVIGVIAKQYNVQKALDFATAIIIEANPELTKPVTFGNFDPIYLYNESKADKDYLNKIYPSPFSYEHEYYSEYMNISYALSKILKIAIIGNETVEKRKLIANNLNKVLPIDTYDRYEGYYQYVVTYLYYGIEETIKRYRTIVESSYREYLKK